MAFDEKNGHELVQILYDVLAELDKAHRADARDEPEEVAGPRIISFLQLLKYALPPPATQCVASLVAAYAPGFLLDG